MRLFRSEKLAARMELEFKRLQRRKLFMANSDSGPSSIPNSPGSSSSTGTGQASSSNKDQPLFTLKQVLLYILSTVIVSFTGWGIVIPLPSQRAYGHI